METARKPQARTRRRFSTNQDGRSTIKTGCYVDDECADEQCSREAILLLHKPQCAETQASMLMVEAVACEGVEDTWYALTPSRVGHDKTFDLASRALMMACWYRRKVPGVTATKLFRSLGCALAALRHAMRVSLSPWPA